jgi:site-specific DNA-methyltransferase (adenine-specific)
MTRPEPYFDDGQVSLYLGDCREVLPALGVTADLVLADPPYGETSLAWDHWPDGWLEVAAKVSRSLWCFGSMRMFLEHGAEFKAVRWKLSQDVIWEKGSGTGFATDRFKRVHEHALHWYRGPWGAVRHEVPRVAATLEQVARNGTARRQRAGAAHLGAYGSERPWSEDGTRLMRSVVKVPNLRGRAIAPTEKPVPLLVPLIEYACPPGGLVVDLFAASCSALEAARSAGRRAVGIEVDGEMCEKAARRLSQATLFGEVS